MKFINLWEQATELKLYDFLVYYGFKWKRLIVEDVADILSAEPDYLVIGSGSSGMMQVSDRLKQHLGDIGVKVII